MFLFFYLLTVVGNIIIITIIQIETRLQTPMYFFLTNLSFLDICYTSTDVPQMLSNMVGRKKTIPFPRCATRWASPLLGNDWVRSLGVMAYDRYVAICHPLHYTVIMNQSTCVQLAGISWASSFCAPQSSTSSPWVYPTVGPMSWITSSVTLPFPGWLALTPSFTEMVVFVFTVVIVFIFLLIAVSYARILLTVLRMRSASGRHKALSTCASHLTVVAHGTGIFMYMRPQSKTSRAGGKIIAVFYTVITPMLKPLIYSLRNQDKRGPKQELWQNGGHEEHSMGHYVSCYYKMTDFWIGSDKVKSSSDGQYLPCQLIKGTSFQLQTQQASWPPKNKTTASMCQSKHPLLNDCSFLTPWKILFLLKS